MRLITTQLLIKCSVIQDVGGRTSKNKPHVTDSTTLSPVEKDEGGTAVESVICAIFVLCVLIVFWAWYRSQKRSHEKVKNKDKPPCYKKAIKMPIPWPVQVLHNRFPINFDRNSRYKHSRRCEIE